MNHTKVEKCLLLFTANTNISERGRVIEKIVNIHG